MYPEPKPGLKPESKPGPVQSEVEHVRIPLTKLAGESLGVRVWEGREDLVVLATIAGGPIDRWNTENESPVLRPGAIIYQVRVAHGGADDASDMAHLAKASQQLTIMARYYRRKVVRVEKARGSILGIRLYEHTNVVESIEEEQGVMVNHTNMEPESNLVLPGDCITHINGQACTGGTAAQMLRDATGTLVLTISNPGCREVRCLRLEEGGYQPDELEE